jgi:hypothetical protein
MANGHNFLSIGCNYTLHITMAIAGTYVTPNCVEIWNHHFRILAAIIFEAAIKRPTTHMIGDQKLMASAAVIA